MASSHTVKLRKTRRSSSFHINEVKAMTDLFSRLSPKLIEETVGFDNAQYVTRVREKFFGMEKSLAVVNDNMLRHEQTPPENDPEVVGAQT